MSVSVREREREREWDSRSVHDDRPRGSVTIRRYHVPDRNEDDRHETASRYSRRETLTSPRQSEFRDSSNVREFRFERDIETERPRDRDLYEYRSERARSPPREDYREVRIEREVSREPPRRERDRDSYELDHYTKTTDYYAREPREAPHPIIIRNDAPTPIIIREQAPQPVIIREERARSPRSEIHREREREREERRTEVEHKSEVNEERTMVKREPSPPQEDEYYYQRTTRELQRRDNKERDDYDDYRSQREIRPRDSASQYGRRDQSEDYYYRREEYDNGERARSKSRHRLHVAEGALAGLAAGGLVNSRRKREGEKSGGLKNLAGGAIVGALGTEIVSRARSRFRDGRSRSGSRERSWEREGRRRHRGHDDSRSRSRSHSQDGFWHNKGNLGKLGAVAAIGALAGYAASRRGKAKEVIDDRRSRSRVRRSSQERDLSVGSDSALNKNHRNSTIAKAGLASAAVAGVVDHVRSRSRGGRSRSRFRTGAPIAAAGIGGAALAGLYEHQKAKKEAREINEERARSASRGGFTEDRQSRRSMSRDPSRQGRGLIEYGDDPIGPAGQYERPQSRGSYYDQYASRRRSRSGSDSMSPRRHRYSSRSRSRDRAADAAAGAGIAGVAAHEASQRRDRKRAERQRRNDEDQPGSVPQSGGGAPYGFGPYSQEPPPVPGPPPQGEYAPAPQEPYHYPPEGFAPPNAYSPVPQFVGAGGPGQNGYDNHAYGGAPQGTGAGPGGYGYQQPPPGQYPPHNVSSPLEASEQKRAGVFKPVSDLELV